jgi:hypothetical protein
LKINDFGLQILEEFVSKVNFKNQLFNFLKSAAKKEQSDLMTLFS